MHRSMFWHGVLTGSLFTLIVVSLWQAYATHDRTAVRSRPADEGLAEAVERFNALIDDNRYDDAEQLAKLAVLEYGWSPPTEAMLFKAQTIQRIQQGWMTPPPIQSNESKRWSTIHSIDRQGMRGITLNGR